MKVIHLLSLSLIVALFFACDDGKNADNGNKDNVNKELNAEFAKEHRELEKEHQEWLDEQRQFDERFLFLKTAYDKVKPIHDPAYDSLTIAQGKLLHEHAGMISKHVALIDEHKNAIKNHKEGKVTTKDLEAAQRDFFEKHKALEDEHTVLVKKYKEFNEQHEKFITDAGGSVADEPKVDALK